MRRPRSPARRHAGPLPPAAPVDVATEADRVGAEKARLVRSLDRRKRRAAARRDDRCGAARASSPTLPRTAAACCATMRRRAPRPRATANSSSTSRTTRCRRCSTAPTRPTTSSSSSASARCSSACCTSWASRRTGRSRAGASATSTSSTRKLPEFPGPHPPRRLGHAGARAAPVEVRRDAAAARGRCHGQLDRARPPRIRWRTRFCRSSS